VCQSDKRFNYCIDSSKEEFESALKVLFNNDIKRLVAKYYDTVVEMISYAPPDIIGHLDVIKKLNVNDRYYSEEESWYQKMVNEVIMAISKSKCVLEVNTRGFYKSITPDFYPSRRILEKCVEADIPVTISSDAHHPNELDLNFLDVVAILKELGYRHIYQFDIGKWSRVEIT
jgi:histidinol-phosphatase (PHP family)